jgi:hypothetical protein
VFTLQAVLLVVAGIVRSNLVIRPKRDLALRDPPNPHTADPALVT